MKLLLVAALIAVPGAAALDALPGAARLDATEARVLVRVADGAALRVRASGPVLVALAPPGGAPGAFAPAPVELPVGAADAWRGLPGAVEVVLRRSDPGRAVQVELDDGDSGVLIDWPAGPVRGVPLPSLGPALALGVGARLLPARGRSPRAEPF